MAMSNEYGPWQRLLERYCKVLGVSLVIDKIECFSSKYYRVVLTSPDSALLTYTYLDASFGAKLVQIRKKNNNLAICASYDFNAEIACKKHLLEMLGNDLEIWRDGNGVEAGFFTLTHAPDTIDALKVHLDLAEGSGESCREARDSV